jgi:hypothetical protein
MTTAEADCKNEKIARHVEAILDDHVLVESTSRDKNVVEFTVPTSADYQRVIESSQLQGLPISWIP